MFSFIKYMAARLRKENDGVALSEYLILLGLLVGGVIAAVLLFGTELSAAWGAWANWIGLFEAQAPTTLTTPTPTPTPTPGG
jgi:pilus assembly protein Flp/PilA